MKTAGWRSSSSLTTTNHLILNGELQIYCLISSHSPSIDFFWLRGQTAASLAKNGISRLRHQHSIIDKQDAAQHGKHLYEPFFMHTDDLAGVNTPTNK